MFAYRVLIVMNNVCLSSDFLLFIPPDNEIRGWGYNGVSRQGGQAIKSHLPTVFKSFKWNLLYIIPMTCRSACHTCYEAPSKGSRVMPLFEKFLFPYLLWQSVDRCYILIQSVFTLKTFSVDLCIVIYLL